MDQATDLVASFQKFAHHSPAKKASGASDQNYQLVLLMERILPFVNQNHDMVQLLQIPLPRVK
jgi:hypothetical protein